MCCTEQPGGCEVPWSMVGWLSAAGDVVPAQFHLTQCLLIIHHTLRWRLFPLTGRRGVFHPLADLGSETLYERVDLVTHTHGILHDLHGVHQRGTGGWRQLRKYVQKQYAKLMGLIINRNAVTSVVSVTLVTGNLSGFRTLKTNSVDQFV